MSPRLSTRRIGLIAVVLALTLGLAPGCSTNSQRVALPSPPVATTPKAGPAATVAPDPTCDPKNPAVSFAPNGQAGGAMVGRVKARGYLIAAVSADTLLFGFRNPLTGNIEGFDVDVVREIAKEILGDPSKVVFKVVNYAGRIPSLQDGSADIVADVMTINCTRWNQINFSSQYFEAGQTFLVAKGSPYGSVTDLDGKRVCVASGSTNLEELAKLKAGTTLPNGTPVKANLIPVTVDDVSDCMVLFQQGSVDAVTGDNTVLAGFVQQDPFAQLIAAAPITAEPYGLGMAKKLAGPGQGEGQENTDFARFVNGVLARMRADGTWAQLYQKWLHTTPPPPPVAQYGRP